MKIPLNGLMKREMTVKSHVNKIILGYQAEPPLRQISLHKDPFFQVLAA